MIGQSSYNITPVPCPILAYRAGSFFISPVPLGSGDFLFHFAQKNNCFTENAYIIKLLICVNKWLIGGIFGI